MRDNEKTWVCDPVLWLPDRSKWIGLECKCCVDQKVEKDKNGVEKWKILEKRFRDCGECVLACTNECGTKFGCTEKCIIKKCEFHRDPTNCPKCKEVNYKCEKLLEAGRLGKPKDVHECVEAMGKIDISLVRDGRGRNVLHYACQNGNV